MIIAIWGRGGVGKTTIACGLEQHVCRAWHGGHRRHQPVRGPTLPIHMSGMASIRNTR